MRLALVLLVAAGLLVLAGCASAPAGGRGGVAASACEQAMETAAEVDEMSDTLEDLYDVVRACANLAEFRAASEQFPEALDGVDPEVILPNLCANPDAGISDTPICFEVR
jgi:hypothetical protein